MRTGRHFLFAVLIAAASAIAATQSPADQYAGVWSGTWEGPGTGQFELTLSKGKEGEAAGKVAVTTDNGNYTADLKSLTFDGTKMSAKYDFPLDPSAEVIVGGTFDEKAAKGTWSLRAKGQDAEVAGGTWSVAKK